MKALIRQQLNSSAVYNITGRLLISLGIVLGGYLSIRLTGDFVENQIAQQQDFLLIASTPVFAMPPATPLPTLTPTPVPTATPLPLPAIRLSIPAIHVNTSIQEVFPVEKVLFGGVNKAIWEVPAFAAGHYSTSGNPGGGRNIVLIGHNNIRGEVFRDLNRLDIGDEIILFTEQGETHYQVQKKFIIPYRGTEEEGDAKLQAYAAPQLTEMVTIISCWPYLTNANRIVVIAVPRIETGSNGT